jgi:HEAT repeat protein
MKKAFILSLLLLVSCTGPTARKTAPAGPQPQPPAPAVSDWDRKISSENFTAHGDRIGQASLETLAMGGPASAPKVADYLADPSPQVRAKAVEILAGFGKEAEPGLGRVHELCRDVNPATRQAAAKALALIAHPASKNHLKALLKDPHPAVRIWAHAATARLAGDCEDHFEEITDLLKSAPEAAEDAVGALELLRCPNDDAIDTLGKLLDTKEENSRIAAARALGACAEKAVGQVPKLAGLLEDSSLRLRLAALSALSRLGPHGAQAVPALTKMLKDSAPRLRELAAQALGQMGPAAREARPVLEQLASDPVDTVQAAARRALKQIGE